MYIIEQKTDFQWEPIPEGEFDTLGAALAAVDDLKGNIGWNGLRVVDKDGDRVSPT